MSEKPNQEHSAAGEAMKQTFKCSGCGAQMEYKPGSSVQACPYCGHENPIPQSEADIRELDFRAHLEQCIHGEILEEQLTIACSECGASMTTDPNVTAQECAFCGAPIVSTTASSKKIKPRALLPFKITREEGCGLFRRWIAKRWFAPGDLKRRARHEDRLSGVYVPYWTYDCDTTSFYRGQRGEHYWVSESYTTVERGKTVRKTRRVRKTRWYPVSGTVWAPFDDVLILASDSLPRKYTERLEPWDLMNLVPYDDAYLGGFKAESYRIDLAQGFEYARDIMDQRIRVLVRRDIGGDEQRIHSINTQYDDITFKHLLLPVWISVYRYKNKVYRFLVNGRTGEVQGERPWSWIKITLAALAGVLVVGAIIVLVMSQQQ